MQRWILGKDFTGESLLYDRIASSGTESSIDGPHDLEGLLKSPYSDLYVYMRERDFEAKFQGFSSRGFVPPSVTHLF
jgi:hypothetical protein